MDSLFGGIQRTDAEIAVLDSSGSGTKVKNDGGESQHIENVQIGAKMGGGDAGALTSVPTMPVLYEKEGERRV